MLTAPHLIFPYSDSRFQVTIIGEIKAHFNRLYNFRNGGIDDYY